ncbi:hypothetical protein [Chamaesiphon sp. VAR_48_metabat_135_sub]|uniref:hypothetical protein n=1 Tax=Chamaesiphon sp. VAR_48_metabat_135_sub TaxID=2964699 RepID=UPI00286BAE0C|nr:hypothetical protein [Chamaesiphon sp. VAR_48_metabat_135_sub]
MKIKHPLLPIIGIAIIATNLSAVVPALANKTLKSNSLPTSGKVLKLTNGDLMCYVDLIDARGKKYNLGASFDICNQTKLLNKQVRLNYKPLKVNDCQSNEPCGKTRIENSIVKMKLVTRK